MFRSVVRFLLLVFCLVSGQISFAFAESASLNEERILEEYEFQKTPVWCWAAAIQMALNYQGLDVSQEDIVVRTFGLLIPTAGNSYQISNNLNTVFIKDNRRFLVSSVMLPIQGSQIAPPSPLNATMESLVSHLERDRPIIMSYHVPGWGIGHAVLLSGLDYSVMPNGKLVINGLTVRDPYPYNPQHVQNGGRIDYVNYGLPGIPQAVWLVDAVEI